MQSNSSSKLALNKLELIDEQFAFDLARFGNEQHTCQVRAGIFAFSFGVLVGFIFSLLQQNLFLFNFSVFFIFVSIAYTHSLSMSLVKTFSLHDYEQVWRDFGKTLFWCKSWAPFSQMQLKLISIVQNETLANQGRYAELEAVTRMQWACNQREVVYSGMPKKIELADVLAVSYMGQKRYTEAISILENLAKTTSGRYIHRSILYSLSYCYMESGQHEKAYLLMENNEKIMTQKPFLGLALDHSLVRAQIEISRQNFEEASQIMQELSGHARDNKFAPEFRAHYFRILASLRNLENREEEAELHLKTALDIIKAAPSLNLLSLSETYGEYAHFLENSGREEEANCMKQESEHFENAYLQKQLARLDDIRSRLSSRSQKSPISIERLICETA